MFSSNKSIVSIDEIDNTKIKLDFQMVELCRNNNNNNSLSPRVGIQIDFDDRNPGAFRIQNSPLKEHKRPFLLDYLGSY